MANPIALSIAHIASSIMTEPGMGPDTIVDAATPMFSQIFLGAPTDEQLEALLDRAADEIAYGDLHEIESGRWEEQMPRAGWTETTAMEGHMYRPRVWLRWGGDAEAKEPEGALVLEQFALTDLGELPETTPAGY